MEDFDQEGYRNDKKKKTTLTMPQIILEQVKRIVELGSKEFRGGYEEETIITIDGKPQIMKKYIEDGRQAYCNAVMSLYILTSSWYGRTLTDKEKQKELLIGVNEIKKTLDGLYNEYITDLKKVGADQQQIKYKYLSNKRELCADLFSELILIIQSSEGVVARDYDQEEEDKYDD